MLNNIVKEMLNGLTRIVGWGLTTLVIALVDGWMDGFTSGYWWMEAEFMKFALMETEFDL